MSEQANSPHKACTHPEATARVGQVIIGEKLLWTRSYSCPHCTAIEEDGDGMPPKEARALLLAQNGVWELVVTGNTGAALKVLKSALGLSMAEAEDFLHNLPVAYTGTKTEAEWLQAQMTAAGITSRVERSRSAS